MLCYVFRNIRKKPTIYIMLVCQKERPSSSFAEKTSKFYACYLFYAFYNMHFALNIVKKIYDKSLNIIRHKV